MLKRYKKINLKIKKIFKIFENTHARNAELPTRT